MSARKREDGEGSHYRLAPRRWENAGLTEEEGEEKTEGDFDFSSGEKVASHGDFVFEASSSSHD